MKKLPLTVIALAVSALLTACGGGGGSDTPAAAAGTSLSGTVATGSAVKNAKVEIKDAKGQLVEVSTNDNGVYSVDVSKLTAPFLIKASGGILATTGKVNSTDLYSVSAAGEQTANITPLTKLLVAQLSNQLPEDAFSKADSVLLNKLANKTELTAAMNAIVAYVAKNTGVDATTLGNLVTAKLDAVTAGDKHDEMLEKLAEKDPNFANKSIELIKDKVGKVTLDPAKETLGQCIASLSLPKDLNVSATSESDLAVYSWDGHKKVDWSGQQQFKEGWIGGIFKDYFGGNTQQVVLDNESVLQTFNELVIQEDTTDYLTQKKYPFTVKSKEYRTLDRKKVLGWRDDYFNQEDKAMVDWQQKNNLASAARYNQIYDLVVDKLQTDAYSRKSRASWQNDAVYTEDLQTEYRFEGRKTIDTKLGKVETCVSSEKTNLVQKGPKGDVRLNVVWTAKRWHVPKLGYVKYETSDTETDASGKVLLMDEKRNYEIVGARKNGQRYGSYDLWTGILTAQPSSSVPNQYPCNYSATGMTTGAMWIVKPLGNSGLYHNWNGETVADFSVSYPGQTRLDNFKYENFDNANGTGKMSWSQVLNFDLANKVLTGSYTRTEVYSKPAVCTGTYPSSVQGSKVF